MGVAAGLASLGQGVLVWLGEVRAARILDPIAVAATRGCHHCRMTPDPLD